MSWQYPSPPLPQRAWRHLWTTPYLEMCLHFRLWQCHLLISALRNWSFLKLILKFNDAFQKIHFKMSMKAPCSNNYRHVYDLTLDPIRVWGPKIEAKTIYDRDFNFVFNNQQPTDCKKTPRIKPIKAAFNCQLKNYKEFANTHVDWITTTIHFHMVTQRVTSVVR